jgi:signal peptidase I
VTAPPNTTPIHSVVEGEVRRRGIITTGAGLTAAAAVIVAARGRFRRFEIVNESMRPALEPGDWVVAHYLRHLPARGDVVVFEHEERPGLSLVKRVVGMPGETVEIGNGQVHVGGAVLPEPWASGFTQPELTVPVPEGTVFVLGDHRVAAGGDSRTLGPIPAESLRWRVIGRYWPPSRIGPVTPV